uniref:Uncharacterized protein n=1 Tax=Ascaris lumbricoides TaxID=6252 RepID=A0A0M3I017_ASCLU
MRLIRKQHNTERASTSDATIVGCNGNGLETNHSSADLIKPPDAVGVDCIPAAKRLRRKQKSSNEPSSGGSAETRSKRRGKAISQFLETFVRKVFDTQRKVGCFYVHAFISHEVSDAFQDIS